jgi:hypothetical protein
VEKVMKSYADCPARGKHNPRAARRQLPSRLKGIAHARQPNPNLSDEPLEDRRRAGAKPPLKTRARLDPDGEAR